MEKPLEDVQDEILSRVQAGEDVDRDAVLAAHPQHASALDRFFRVLDEIEGGGARGGPVFSPTARFGEFRILREIGRGGMGIVYEAEQTSLKRRVALKILPPALCGDRRVVARFRREAESAGRLRHPHIVAVHSVGEANGTPFFAMERVEGPSLAAVLAERRGGDAAGLPMPGEPWRAWVAGTIAKVADALAYAHRQGVLHRDVKPANILLEADGTPRLTDFGLALDLGAPGLTQSGESFGTPLYMSPEQAVRREQPLDARTDVYSLGVTLYESLTLRTPYEAVTAMEVLAALLEGRIVPPHAADPDLPPSLEAVVLRALERDPTRRYATADALAADLRAVLEHRPAVEIESPAAAAALSRVPGRGPAPRPAPVPTLPRAPGRRRWLIPVAVGVGALVLVAVGLLLARRFAAEEGGGTPGPSPVAGRAPLGAPPWPLVRPEGAPEGVLVSQAQLDEAKRLGVPVWFENSIGMRFVLIPAGTFGMGSSPGSPVRNPEWDFHEVTLTRAFYLQGTEVPWTQWRRWDRAGGLGLQDDGIPLDADDLPAVGVNGGTRLEDFVTWVGVQDPSHRYRLPTEAEWEHACRAGTTTPWFWGDDPAQAWRFANVADVGARAKYPQWAVFPGPSDGFVGPAPVGSFLPNPWGLRDTIGNVAELVADGWHGRLGTEARTDPPAAPVAEARVGRGGTWAHQQYQAQSAARKAIRWETGPWVDTGFRLAVDLPDAPR